jgi:hypothetical protein
VLHSFNYLTKNIWKNIFTLKFPSFSYLTKSIWKKHSSNFSFTLKFPSPCSRQRVFHFKVISMQYSFLFFFFMVWKLIKTITTNLKHNIKSPSCVVLNHQLFVLSFTLMMIFKIPSYIPADDAMMCYNNEDELLFAHPIPNFPIILIHSPFEICLFNLHSVHYFIHILCSSVVHFFWKFCYF